MKKQKQGQKLDMKKLVDIHVSKKIYKSFENAIKSGHVKGATYSHTTEDKQHKEMMIVFISTTTIVNTNDMRLGLSIASLKDAIEKKKLIQKREEETKGAQPIRFKVPGAAVKYIKSKNKELQVVKTVALMDENATVFYFDMSMCLVEGERIARALFLQDTIHAAVRKLDKKDESDYIQSVIKALNEGAPHMTKTSESLIRLTGTELRWLGHSVQYRILSKKKPFARFVELLFGQRRYERYYCDRVLDPIETYVVKLKKPRRIDSQPIDHAKEVALHYDFGEQFYSGLGTKYVEKYMKSIANTVEDFQVQPKGIDPKTLKVEK